MLTTKHFLNLWEKYRDNSSIKNRNLLYESCHYWVRNIAKRISSTLPPCSIIDIDDLVSVGFIGFLEAIHHYNGTCSLLTYIQQIVSGRMYDSIRQVDIMSRTYRQKQKKTEQIRSDLQQSLSREPHITEMESAVAQVHKINGSTTILKVSDEKKIVFYSICSRLDKNKISEENIPGKSLTVKNIEREDLLCYLFAYLTKNEKIILTLYYLENFNLREISKIIGISESGTCQIKNEALNIIKERIKNSNLLVA